MYMTRVTQRALAQVLNLMPSELAVVESLGHIAPEEIHGKVKIFIAEDCAKRIRDAAKPGSRLHRMSTRFLDSKNVAA